MGTPDEGLGRNSMSLRLTQYYSTSTVTLYEPRTELSRGRFPPPGGLPKTCGFPANALGLGRSFALRSRSSHGRLVAQFTGDSDDDKDFARNDEDASSRHGAGGDRAGQPRPGTR